MFFNFFVNIKYRFFLYIKGVIIIVTSQFCDRINIFFFSQINKKNSMILQRFLMNLRRFSTVLQRFSAFLLRLFSSILQRFSTILRRFYDDSAPIMQGLYNDYKMVIQQLSTNIQQLQQFYRQRPEKNNDSSTNSE